MIVVYMVIIIGVLWIVLEVLNRNFWAVTLDVPLAELSDFVRRYARRSMDNSDTMIFHRESNTVIQVHKTLSLTALSDIRKELVNRRLGKPHQPIEVELCVLKKHASQPRWAPDDLASRLLSHSMGSRLTRRIRGIPRRALPTQDTGEVITRIDCGASLSKVEEAIEEIVMADTALALAPRFDVWAVNCGSGVDIGDFED